MDRMAAQSHGLARQVRGCPMGLRGNHPQPGAGRAGEHLRRRPDGRGRRTRLSWSPPTYCPRTPPNLPRPVAISSSGCFRPTAGGCAILAPHLSSEMRAVARSKPVSLPSPGSLMVGPNTTIGSTTRLSPPGPPATPRPQCGSLKLISRENRSEWFWKAAASMSMVAAHF